MKQPDHNADRDGHLSEEYMVIKADKDPRNDSLELDGQEMKFGRDGAFKLRGHARARALRQKYDPRDVVVTRMRHSVEQGHRYFFTSPGMPWHKYDENGKRIIEETPSQEDEKEEKHESN